MINDINYIDTAIVKIDDYFKKNDFNIDLLGPEYVNSEIVINVDGYNIIVEVAALNAFLFNEQENFIQKRDKIQEKFNVKFPNKKPNE